MGSRSDARGWGSPLVAIIRSKKLLRFSAALICAAIAVACVLFSRRSVTVRILDTSRRPVVGARALFDIQNNYEVSASFAGVSDLQGEIIIREPPMHHPIARLYVHALAQDGASGSEVFTLWWCRGEVVLSDSLPEGRDPVAAFDRFGTRTNFTVDWHRHPPGVAWSVGSE